MPRPEETSPASAENRLRYVHSDRPLLHRLFDTAPPSESQRAPRYRPAGAGKLYEIFSGESARTD